MSDELVLEKVEPSDKEEIEELSAGIWDGRDYVPLIFDRWVEEGGFYKGVLNGKIIAIDKYTWLEDGVIWLEGLRIHPDYQGMGYGREMLYKFSEIVEELDYEKLKFMTAGTNNKIKHLAEEKGFSLVQSYYFLYMEKDEIEEMVDNDYVRKSDEISEVESAEDVWDLVESSEEFRFNKEQYLANWTAHEMDFELVKDKVGRGVCYTMERNGRVLGVIFFHFDEYRNILSIPFIAGDEESLSSLMRFGIEKAVERDASIYSVKTASKKVKYRAEKVGFELSDIEKSLLYEKS